MKLYVLDCGYQTTDMNSLVGNTTFPTLDNLNPGYIWKKIPINCFLIDHPDVGYILFDTACDPLWKEHWNSAMQVISPYTATEDQFLLSRLDQLNVSPDDVKIVIMSHLHVDHAGNLKHFKNAKIFVDNNEITNVVRQFFLREKTFAHMRSDIQQALEAELTWRPVMEDENILEVAKGVKIVRAGSGHSFGMLAMHVSLDSGKQFLMVADAIYMPENIYPELKVPGNVYDTVGYRRAAVYLKKYAEENGAEILYGHCMDQFETLTHSTEGYYE